VGKVLSREDNELLVRVGPGTPMGNLFRRFWTPIALASEVGPPDSPPVRVDVVGESFVAFRDSDGELGLLDAYCRTAAPASIGAAKKRTGFAAFTTAGSSIATAGASTCRIVPKASSSESA
jgi:hypothetical protein